MMKQHPQIVHRCMPLILILLPVIAFCAGCHNHVARAHLSASEESVQWDAPAHFTFKGKTYVYSNISAELPDGYNYAGKTTSGLFSESNVDGTVYINDENLDAAYFQWTDWDESVDGPEPYLCFTIESSLESVTWTFPSYFYYE